jgi:hypothetical protein
MEHILGASVKGGGVVKLLKRDLALQGVTVV